MQFKFKLEDRTSYNYKEYREMLDKLMADGETTGKDQSDEMIEYTKVNIVRMNRLDKTVKIKDHLKSALLNAPPQTWVVLNEAWCGDAAQNLPIISKMVDFAFNVDFKIILRDDNPDIMDKFLTKKGRSIPKLISIDENNKVLFTWGPRPEKMQAKALELKAAGEEYGEEVHKLYANDRATSIQAEFVELLNAIKA